MIPSQPPSGPQVFTNQPALYSAPYNARTQNFSSEFRLQTSFQSLHYLTLITGSDAMAVHPVVNRQMYPPSMGGYHPSHAPSPTSMHPSHQDLQARGMYGHGFGFPQQMFAYPQYALPTHPAYATHPSSQTYPPVSPAGSAILMSQQPTSTLHSSPSHGVSGSPRLKIEPSHLKLEHPFMKVEQNVMQRPMSNIEMAQSTAAPSSTSSPPAGPGSNTAAPGPIPATTPLVVRQDQNGVQWIAFEYSRDRVKMEYQIRCDVESVVIEELTPEFKTANCVYPGAYSGKEGYKGNRLHYESECNAVGWALAHLNPALREKRGLIQRAVDSWRNSNQDPRLRSRRVRRQAKINNRKAQLRQPDGPISLSPAEVLASRVQPVMSMDSTRPPPLNLAAGQLHHHHSTSDGSGGESGMFHM